MKSRRPGRGSGSVVTSIFTARNEDSAAGVPPQAPTINDPRFRRAVERIHRLGTRALGELFAEVGTDRDTLENYADLTPSMLHGTGGDRWPVSVYEMAST